VNERGTAEDATLEFEAGVARVVFAGPFEFESWRRTFERLVAHASFVPGMPCLWDIRGADTSAIDRHGLVTIADYMKDHGGARGRGKTAIVAASDLDFGVSRMYEGISASTTPVELRVCRSTDEAERWLRG